MKHLAQILSIILYPMMIPTYAMGILCYAIHQYSMPLPSAYVWVAILGTFFLTCCVPLSAIILLIRQKAISDIYLRDSQERRTPYLYSLFSCGFWCYFLYSVLHIPPVILAMALAATGVLLCVMVITHWWKISAHLSFMGTLLATVIGYSWHTGLNPVGLIIALLGLSLLLMYARIYLDQHTPAQVIWGFVLGLTLPLLSILFV